MVNQKMHYKEYCSTCGFSELVEGIGRICQNRNALRCAEIVKDTDSCECWGLNESDDKRGWYPKYQVINLENGHEVFPCMVLRPDRDPAAVAAMYTYAATTTNQKLAQDILQMLDDYQGGIHQ